MENIYLYVEEALRELDSKLLLAVLAARKGHRCLVADQTSIFRGIRAGLLGRGIFHTKSLTPSVQKFSSHEFLLRRGHRITSLDEEGGLVSADFGRDAVVRFSEATVAQCSAIFCWGSKDSDFLRATYPKFSSLFHKTGSPRVDLWTSKLSWPPPPGLPSKPYLLVSSNFSILNGDRSFREIISSHLKAGYYSRDPQLFQEMFEGIASEAQIVGRLILALTELQQNQSKIDVVIRPHPAESVEGWETFVSAISNIHVIRSGPIGPWIARSSVFLHVGSTSVYEALFSGIPVLSFSPDVIRPGHEWAQKIGEPIRDGLDLRLALERLTRKEMTSVPSGETPLILDAIRESVHLRADQLAAERIVDIWTSLGRGRHPPQISGTLLMLVLRFFQIAASGRGFLSLAGGAGQESEINSLDLLARRLSRR